LPFLERLLPVVSRITSNFEVIFSLDPSTDNTELVISQASSRYPQIKLVKMSRRFGQPAATMAGLTLSQGAKIVVIDVDLQDPPEVIELLNSKFDEGLDVVYATRRSRKGESLLKKLLALFGYKVINRLSDVQIPRNTGDFRIMSRRVVDEICGLSEKHGFLRGLVAYVGFNQTGIIYDRDERFVGKENYNRCFGSLKIGLIGFSAKPLSLMAASVAVISFLSFCWEYGISCR
jgi:dolichol-phosphate mannosyltransferase